MVVSPILPLLFAVFLLFHKIKGSLYFSDISDYKIKQMNPFSPIFLKY